MTISPKKIFGSPCLQFSVVILLLVFFAVSFALLLRSGKDMREAEAELASAQAEAQTETTTIFALRTLLMVEQQAQTILEAALAAQEAESFEFSQNLEKLEGANAELEETVSELETDIQKLKEELK